MGQFTLRYTCFTDDWISKHSETPKNQIVFFFGGVGAGRRDKQEKFGPETVTYFSSCSNVTDN